MTAKASPRIVALVGEALNAQSAMQSAEQDFKAKKARFRDLLENIIPEALDAEEVDTVELPTGDVVTIKSVTRASITEERRELAYDYLRQVGLDGMIKGQLIVQFGLKEYALFQSFKKMMERVFPDMPVKLTWEGPGDGSDQRVVQSLEALMRDAIGPDRKIIAKETVPGPTLTSWVRKQLDSGVDFPADLFGAVRVREAQIPGLKPVPEVAGELFD